MTKKSKICKSDQKNKKVLNKACKALWNDAKYAWVFQTMHHIAKVFFLNLHELKELKDKDLKQICKN